MSTLPSSPQKVKQSEIYLWNSALCLLFHLIYKQFSHGVHSPYMTWAFLFPLALGFLCCRLLGVLPRLYHFGVATVTVSSLLRGILEIAGTSSRYQRFLMLLGLLELLAGVLLYAFDEKGKPSPSA